MRLLILFFRMLIVLSESIPTACLCIKDLSEARLTQRICICVWRRNLQCLGISRGLLRWWGEGCDALLALICLRLRSCLVECCGRQ